MTISTERSEEIKIRDEQRNRGLEATQNAIAALLTGDFEIVLKRSELFSNRGNPKWDNIFNPSATTQISTLSKELGKKHVTKCIYVYLARLNNYFNVARPMTAEQMEELAMEMTVKLWYLKFEEIDVIVEGIKNKVFGNVYERLDPSIIWEHINSYELERDRYAESKAQERKTTEIKLETEGDRVGRGIVSTVGGILSSQDAAKKIR